MLNRHAEVSVKTSQESAATRPVPLLANGWVRRKRVCLRVGQIGSGNALGRTRFDPKRKLGKHLSNSDSILSTPASSRAQRLTSWWHSALGAQLLAEQEPLISSEVRRFHGDNLLWLGCHSPSAESVRRCMVRNRYLALAPLDPAGTQQPATAISHAIAGSVDTRPDQAGNDLVVKEVFPEGNIATFRTNPQELPLAKGSMDAVMVHHMLECADDPRALLREVARVLAPGGRVVLCLFNPVSLWGVANVTRRCQGLLMPQRQQNLTRLLARHRLLDWLALLGLEVDSPTRYCGYGLSKESGRRTAALQQWLQQQQVPIAKTFILAATKRQRAQGPRVRSTAIANAKLAPVTYPKLAAWNRLDQDR